MYGISDIKPHVLTMRSTVRPLLCYSRRYSRVYLLSGPHSYILPSPVPELGRDAKSGNLPAMTVMLAKVLERVDRYLRHLSSFYPIGLLSAPRLQVETRYRDCETWVLPTSWSFWNGANSLHHILIIVLYMPRDRVDGASEKRIPQARARRRPRNHYLSDAHSSLL